MRRLQDYFEGSVLIANSGTTVLLLCMLISSHLETLGVFD